jgi:hypothetical protein
LSRSWPARSAGCGWAEALKKGGDDQLAGATSGGASCFIFPEISDPAVIRSTTTALTRWATVPGPIIWSRRAHVQRVIGRRARARPACFAMVYLLVGVFTTRPAPRLRVPRTPE